MLARFRPSYWLVALAALTLVLAGCPQDDIDRDPTGGGGGVPGGSASNNDTDADDGDVDQDAEDVDDVVDELCEYEPSSQSTDPTKPCCFDHEDCWDSNIANSEDMYCYYPTCEEDGEGTCRFPPGTEMQCWDDLDCPEGYRCPHEDNADQFSCHEPQLIETPATCVEED